jgi:hypothetical protein
MDGIGIKLQHQDRWRDHPPWSQDALGDHAFPNVYVGGSFMDEPDRAAACMPSLCDRFPTHVI